MPAQRRTLVPWPDGSPRWVQLDFQANADGAYAVLQQDSGSQVAMPLHVQRGEGECSVTVGQLQVRFGPRGPSPVQEIAWRGQRLTGSDAPLSIVAIDESGKAFPLAFRDTGELKIEAEGPLRFQASWEAEHRDGSGEPLLRVRLRMEFLAGIEGFALSYQFFHVLPGHDFLRLRSIVVRFGFGGLGGPAGRVAVAQTNHGLIGLPEVADVPGLVSIRLDRSRGAPYVDSLASIGDASEYPYFLEPHAHLVGEAVALKDERAAVAFVMESFTCQRPKELSLRSGEITLAIWPEWAGTLSLPQGRSCAQRFSFRFADSADGSAGDLLRSCLVSPRTSLYLRPVVGWLHPEDSAAAGLTWDQPRLFHENLPGAAHFSYLLKTATGGLQSLAEMFHFGDTPAIDYTVTYTSFAERAGAGEAQQAGLPFSDAGFVHTAFHPVENLKTVWTNNEYDVIYCLALEALRTQSGAVLEKLRAAVRHQIEVDFVHYSDHWQHHRGTPAHTYDHVVCSSAYPSHQWTQGLYYYYCLTGDDDVPEVVRAICDFNLRWLQRPELQFVHGFNRELGWGALALVYGYELTGDEKYRAAAESVLRELERFAYSEGPSGGPKQDHVLRPECARLLGAAFAVNTILMALMAYHQATGATWAKELFLQWVAVGLDNYNHKASGTKITELFPESLAYACELTGERRCLQQSLWHVQMFMWLYRPDLWSFQYLSNRLYGKTYARGYRGLVHFLSACARAGLLEDAERTVFGIGKGGA